MELTAYHTGTRSIKRLAAFAHSAVEKYAQIFLIKNMQPNMHNAIMFYVHTYGCK